MPDTPGSTDVRVLSCHVSTIMDFLIFRLTSNGLVGIELLYDYDADTTLSSNMSWNLSWNVLWNIWIRLDAPL